GADVGLAAGCGPAIAEREAVARLVAGAMLAAAGEQREGDRDPHAAIWRLLALADKRDPRAVTTTCASRLRGEDHRRRQTSVHDGVVAKRRHGGCPCRLFA